MEPSLIQPWHVLAFGLFCCLPAVLAGAAGGLVAMVVSRRRRSDT